MNPQIKLSHKAHQKGIAITFAKAELEQGSFLSTYSWLTKYVVEALNLKHKILSPPNNKISTNKK